MSTFLLVFVLFAQTAAPRGNADNGKTLFNKIGCYQCHGREAQGSTATGPRLNQNPITYTRFVSYIRKPSGEMPPYTANTKLNATFSPTIHIPIRSPVRASPAARSAPAIMKYSSCPRLQTNMVLRYGSAAARTSGEA